MFSRAPTRFALVVALVASCGGGSADSIPTPNSGSGAESPESAVQKLLDRVAAADFDGAAGLAPPGQAALASLAEGAPLPDVVTGIESGDPQVAANFWAGFAQGAGGFLSSPMTITPGVEIEESGVVFHEVVLDVGGGAERSVYTIDVDGHRIDLFASFGAGLAPRMLPRVERLLDAGTGESRTILIELQTIVPSLMVAAHQSTQQPEAVQELLQLIELITRVS